MFNLSISRIPQFGKASNFFLLYAFSYSLLNFLISAGFTGLKKFAAGRDVDHTHTHTTLTLSEAKDEVHH